MHMTRLLCWIGMAPCPPCWTPPICGELTLACQAAL